MDLTPSRESLELYKLMILYLMNRVDFSLTRSQITDFVLEKGYTNYLTMQQAFSELAETGLLEEKNTMGRTILLLTEEGKSTLSFFENRISEAIRRDMDAFLKENSYELRELLSVTANYYKVNSTSYEAVLNAAERDTTLVEIKLTVPDPQIAASICENWVKKNQEVYQNLTKLLF